VPKKLAKNGNEEKANQSQLRAFRKAARELGLNESEERFQDALRTIAKVKPSSANKKNMRRKTDA
jgi:hypothetical protein